MNKNIFIFGLILILFSFIVNGALTDNLLAYYKLDNNSDDTHSTKDGTNQGGTYTTTAKLGTHSYNTGTTNVRIDLPFGANTTYNQLSYNFWFRSINSGTTTGFDHGNFIAVYWPSTQGLFRIYGYGSGGNQGKLYAQTRTETHITASRYDDNNWHMATLTNDKDGNWSFYIDSTRLYTTGSDGYILPDFNFIIGARRTGATSFSEYIDNAYIDEVGLWNKSLTQSEITELYNSGSGLAYPFSTPSASNCSCTGTANCLLPCNYQLNGTCNVGNYIITINGTGTFTGFNYLKNWNTGYIRGGCNVYN